MKAAVKTVLSGMIGIRRRADHERERVRPAQLVVAAVMLVALFILALLAIVRLVTA